MADNWVFSMNAFKCGGEDDENIPPVGKRRHFFTWRESDRADSLLALQSHCHGLLDFWGIYVRVFPAVGWGLSVGCEINLVSQETQFWKTRVRQSRENRPPRRGISISEPYGARGSPAACSICVVRSSVSSPSISNIFLSLGHDQNTTSVSLVQPTGHSGTGNEGGAVWSRTCRPFYFLSPEPPPSGPSSLACTCTMLLMTMGRIFRGNRRMLNKAKDTKAFWASRMLFLSMVT